MTLLRVASVTAQRVCLPHSRDLSAQMAGALLRLALWQIGKLRHPRPGRTRPNLPLWMQTIALAQDADAQHVGLLGPVARRRRIDRRPAFRTKGLRAAVAAFRGLDVDRRFAGRLEGVAGNRNGNAERGSADGLTIRAVTDRHLFRIDFRFDVDEAAMAGAVDFHETVPPVSSAAASMASMSASDKPK